MIQRNVHIALVKAISNCCLAVQKHAPAAADPANQKNKAMHLGPSHKAGFFFLSIMSYKIAINTTTVRNAIK
jgi:hypothetical protein